MFERTAKLLDRIRPAHVAVVALATSLVFSFLIYPAISRSLNAALDPDGFGRLGEGLWRSGTMAFYPETSPTVSRGPGYPAFVAAMLAVSGGSIRAVCAAQCVLFALTCVLVYWIARQLWNQRIAAAAALLCALYPKLVWYTSRLWIETSATFLLTALAAAIVLLASRPSLPRCLLVGAIIGLAALWKQTFLPFLAILPLLLLLVRKSPMRLRHAGTIALVAALVILPWTIRNWRLTGKFIPVHLLAGFNLQMGDQFARNYFLAPLSHEGLWRRGLAEMDAMRDARIPAGLSQAEMDVQTDRLYMDESLRTYRREPLFLARKMLLNAWMFWTVGDTPSKTAVVMAMSLPLLGLFIAGAARMLRRTGLRSIHGVLVGIVAMYFLFHLPVIAHARLAIVLAPLMISFGVALFYRPPEGQEAEIGEEK